MHNENIENRWESKREISLDPPAVESFLDPARAAEAWPESIANNEVFLEQIKTRKEINECLDSVLTRLPRPDISLEDAIKQGHIDEEQTAKLYNSLNELLRSDDYKRLALYLPFEFLPNKTWRPSTEKLQLASDQFRKTYMKSWKSLLSTHDVRANFVDGDVLEVEQRTGDLPRVVKAAHLIPKLVENGLLEVQDAIELMEESDDQTLKDSIADTLPVLANMGLISEKEIELMEKSKDRLVNNMTRIIDSNMKAKEQPSEMASKTITLSSVQKELNDEFSHIDTQDYGDITKKREAWLKQKKRQETIESLGNDIGAAIIKNDFTDQALAGFLSSEANVASQQALAEGIRKTIESIALADPEKAQTIYAKYKEILIKLWETDKPEARETLSKTFRQLHQLGIVDDKQLAELNINMPKLAGPFSENLKLMEKEMRDLQGVITSIESNPELSGLIYPAALAYGSRLKGYGAQKADVDFAVFVKPGASFSDRTKLQELLKETFAKQKIQGDIAEFWLEQKQNRLEIIDFAKPDVSLGKNYWTHILFGAAWEGNKDVMRQLCKELLVPYMYDVSKTIHGRDARSLYLEELERDTLQYRLMHKGYEQFFPPYGGIHTPHLESIDGKSMFWDSGYRQLATKLFLNRVFLPKIPVAE
jgi:hypothetical protein